MMFYAFAFIFLCYAMEKHSCTADVCYPYKADFYAMCSAINHSVAVGPRCFFQSDQDLLTWNASWAYCRARGGVFAQLHTAREVEMMRNVTMGISGRGPIYERSLMAIRDENVVTGCAMSGTTRWYDDEATPTPVLNTSNTYVAKYYGCIDGTTETAGPRCFSAFVWWDEPCGGGGWWFAPICQITNSFQNFTRTNSCMTETPVETVTAPNGGSDCANLCARRVWCRSDDCAINAGQCPATSPETSACIHYNNY